MPWWYVVVRLLGNAGSDSVVCVCRVLPVCLEELALPSSQANLHRCKRVTVVLGERFGGAQGRRAVPSTVGMSILSSYGYLLTWYLHIGQPSYFGSCRAQPTQAISIHSSPSIHLHPSISASFDFLPARTSHISTHYRVMTHLPMVPSRSSNADGND
ncbi:hypothetical protein IF2G_03236 [Cordyceps javanica]|nr:hypothetical protein IF2G_03236 [Cordyceps javanica]